MSKSRLVSGRIKKATGTELSTDRYEYIDLANVEPDLGLPTVEQSVLIGDTDGTRTWVDITSYAEEFKGYTGSQGDIGFTGSQGDIGFTGSQGYTGSQGDIGYTGSRGGQGIQGYTGSQGDQGITGFTGSQGYTGSRGDVGFIGSAGQDGVDGFTGSQGYTGSQGDMGYTGSAGVDGIDGSIGVDGFTGSQGDIGYTGSKGVAPESIYYAPASITAVVGTYESGNLASIQTFGDNDFYVVNEVSGTPGWNIEINYENVVNFNRIEVALKYEHTSHVIDYEIYNYNTASWDVAGTFNGTSLVFASHIFDIISDSPYILDGEVKTRLYHITPGAANIAVYFDYAAIVLTTQGPEGPQGFTGSRGETGFTGSAGLNGTNGTNGTLGYTGSKGDTGLTGETGFVGSRGDTGFTGSQGYTGSQGVIGFTGSQGLEGFTGSAGNNGFTGSRGADGTSVKIVGTVPTSEDLPVPYTGLVGDGYIVQSSGYLWIWNGSSWFEAGQITGYTGSKGDLGYTGSRGLDGTSGLIGFTGSQGDIGATGYTGSRGAYDAVGFTGSAGGAGFTGSRGAEGYAGSRGYTGSAGLKRWAVVTSAYTISDADRLIADTSAGSFAIELPLNPTSGTYVQITDGADFSVNPLTVLANGSTIENQPDDLVIDLPNTTVEFSYNGVTWNITSTTGPSGFTGSAGLNGLPGEAAAVGYTGSQGEQGYSGVQTKTVDYADTLVVFNGAKRWWINSNYTIRRVLAFLNTPSQGADVKVRVNKNGVESTTLTIPAGTAYIVQYLDTPLILGDYITVDITQIGSVLPGAYLTVTFEYW